MRLLFEKNLWEKTQMCINSNTYMLRENIYLIIVVNDQDISN